MTGQDFMSIGRVKKTAVKLAPPTCMWGLAIGLTQFDGQRLPAELVYARETHQLINPIIMGAFP